MRGWRYLPSERPEQPETFQGACDVAVCHECFIQGQRVMEAVYAGRAFRKDVNLPNVIVRRAQHKYLLKEVTMVRVVSLLHRAIAGYRWRRYWEIIFCAFLVIVAVAIASNGSGRPESRITFLELNLSAAALVGFVTNFTASLFYIAYHQEQSDAWAVAGARLGLTLSGILFALALLRFHSSFSVWWIWDRALVWTVLVVPVYVSYFLLRGYANPGQGPTLAAVLGVLAFLDLPLAYFSVVLRAMRTSLSKQIDRAYSLSGSMWLIVALAATATWLLYRWEITQRKEAEREPIIMV